MKLTKRAVNSMINNIYFSHETLQMEIILLHDVTQVFQYLIEQSIIKSFYYQKQQERLINFIEVVHRISRIS